MNHPGRKYVLLFLLIIPFISQGQQLNYTLSRDFLWGIDRYYADTASSFQTFIKPYRYAQVNSITDSSAVFPRLLAGTKAEEMDKKEKKFELEVYPLISSSVGYEKQMVNETGVGAYLLGNVGKKFSFAFKGFGSKGTYPYAVDSVIREMHIIPGEGFAYPAGTDSARNSYASQQFTGYISWSPNRMLSIQAGQDKHFWGDGYRSLFLSDNAAPYPFLKIDARIWHLNYVCLFTAMKDVTNPSQLKKDWLNKYSTFHYLGWNATKRLNIGLFESIVWQGSDSTRYRGYDVNYLNPVMFFRPTEYSLGSSDNALIGLSLKIKLARKVQCYGQLLIDEFLLKELVKKTGWWANKEGLQLGLKFFDLFRVKRLNFQSEFNYVRPYTYSHGSVQQNYGHFNQPLAHPLGANFAELVNFLNYRYKRLFVELRYSAAAYGADSAGTDYGKNIFISYKERPQDFGNSTGQGFYTKLNIFSVRIAWMLDTRMNLKAEAGFEDRMMIRAEQRTSLPYFFIGLRTDLGNLYRDY